MAHYYPTFTHLRDLIIGHVRPYRGPHRNTRPNEVRDAEIRRRHRDGESVNDLAHEFAISRRRVRRIVHDEGD